MTGVARKRRIDPGQKIKMVIMRGMGFSQVDIAREFGVTRSAISKQLERIRKKFEDHNGIPKFGDEVLKEFWNLLLFSEDLDYSSIIALGNQKFEYENQRSQGMSRAQALRYSQSAQAINNPPWIVNPDFDGTRETARMILFGGKKK